MSSQVARGARPAARADPDPPLLPTMHKQHIDQEGYTCRSMNIRLRCQDPTISLCVERRLSHVCSPPAWCRTFQGFSTLVRLLLVGPMEVPP